MENENLPQFSVSGFLAVTNQVLEMSLGTVYVEGEVASFKINHQKYVFFDLKDSDGSVGCFMTVWQLRTPLEDGMKVLVRATAKVTPWGKFSLTVDRVQPVGEGSLKKSADLLKAKLAKEGLFDEDRKRTLPKIPSRVAVISSTAAAGYADFMKVAGDRFGGLAFIVANVQVQGVGAPEQIVRAITHFNQLVELPDVIVIIRGGGSADDLAAFDDEPLVRAIAGSRVPVLTGIGHETDESLSDLAADVAAVTPTNAAQLLLPDRAVVVERMHAGLYGALQAYERSVDAAADSVSRVRVEAVRQWLGVTEGVLRLVQSRREVLQGYDPEVVLRRGYAMVAGGHKVGDIVDITTKDAHMKARVEEYVKR